MDVEQVVREVVIRSSKEGVDETRASVDQLGASYDKLGTVTEKTTRAQESAEKSLEKLRRQYQDGYREQQKLTEAQSAYERAVSQGLLTQAQASAELASISSKLGAGVAPNRGEDIAAYGKQLDDLRAKYNPLYAAGQQYKTTLGEINQAAKVGAISEAERAAAVMSTKAAFVQQVNTLRGVNDGSSALNQTMKEAKAVSQAWNQSLVAGDPVLKAKAAMQEAITKQTVLGNEAVRLGIATQSQAAAVVAQVTKAQEANVQSARVQAGQLTAGERAGIGFRNAMSGVSGQLVALSAGAGPVGVFLSALGPWGVAAAVGLGAASAAINHMIDESNRIGDGASAMRRLGEVTGLTIEQIKGVTKIGGSMGVDSEKIASGLQKLTVGLEEARKGTGALFDEIRVINPELALELARSTTTAQGIDLIARALKAATLESQRAQLSRATLGRGNADVGTVLIRLADTGGLDAAAEKTRKVTGLTDDWVKEVGRLRDENIQLEKETANVMAATYAKEVLERQNQFLTVQRDIAIEIAKGSAPNKATIQSMAVGSVFGAEPDIAAVEAADRASQLTRKGMMEGALAANDLAAATRAAVAAQNDYTDGADRAAGRSRAMAESHDRELKALQLLTNLEKDRIAALGSAATIDERRIQRINEVNVALGEHKYRTATSTEADERADAARAISAANLDAVIARTSALNGILGIAATVQDAYRARLEQIKKAQMEGAGASDAQITNAKRLALAQADGTFQLQAQIDAMRVQTAASSMTVAAGESYRIIQTKINENLNAGKPAMDGVTDTFMRMAQAMGQAKAAGDLQVAIDQAQFDAKTALLGPLEKEIALLQKRYGVNPQTEEIANLKRTTDALKTAQDAAISFGQALVGGLMQGKSLTDSLHSALDSLSQGMANSAIKDLISGNFEKAGVEAVIAIGSKLLGGAFDDSKEKELKKAQDAWAGMKGEMDDFIRSSKGFDLSPLAQANYQARQTMEKLWTAAMGAGDQTGADAVASAFVHTIWNQMDKFAKQVSLTPDSDTVTAIKNLQESAAQLIQSMKDVKFYSDEAAATINASLTEQIKTLQAQAAKGISADINAASGKGYLNDLNDLFDKVAQYRREQSQTGIDTSLIDRYEAVQAQKIVDQAGLIGDSFNALLDVFPNLTGVVHESSDALQKQADDLAALQAKQQQFYDGLAKDINDFINGLQFGADSTLTPAQQFAAAQGSFQKQSALALGGNQDAASSLTKYAQTYVDQARNYLGPSEAYGAIYNQITAVLQNVLAMQSLGGGATTYSASVPIAYGGSSASSTTSSIASIAPSAPAANDNGTVAELRAFHGDSVNGLSAIVSQMARLNEKFDALVAETKGLRLDESQSRAMASQRAKQR